VLRVKTWDKTRTLDTLAKHFKLLTDIINVQVDDWRAIAIDLASRRAPEESPESLDTAPLHRLETRQP